MAGRAGGHGDQRSRAAEELIERAQPLPELPDAFGRDQLPIVAPIQFNLR